MRETSSLEHGAGVGREGGRQADKHAAAALRREKREGERGEREGEGSAGRVKEGGRQRETETETETEGEKERERSRCCKWIRAPDQGAQPLVTTILSATWK